MPVCVARMVQVPLMSSEAVLAPAPTVQTVGVVEAKATVRPELAVAVRARLDTPVWFGIAGKVMVWVAWLTQKLWLTGGAAP